jgi:hypothetical protein
VDCVARLFRGIDLCRSGLWRRQDLWRLDLVAEDSSHNPLVLLGLSQFPGAPGVVNVNTDTDRYVKSHTYTFA